MTRLASSLPAWKRPEGPVGRPLVGVLPGEGIGPEVVAATLDVLDAVGAEFGQAFDIRFGGSIGLEAEAAFGCSLSEEVVGFCDSVFAEGGAVLCGPGGGRFVYELRRRFDLFCKFTPLRPWSALSDVGALKPHLLQDVDIMLVRENVGGVYFGEQTVERDGEGLRAVCHRFEYGRHLVERIVEVAVKVAQMRRGRLALVVKPGGLELVSALWRDHFERLTKGTGVDASVLGVDNAAYQLIARASEFDVIVSPNMLGDILADYAGVLLGSRGMTSSSNFGPAGTAVYQTGHGAAYDLAGRNEANPIGQISSMAAMLRESFGLAAAAEAVERAVDATLAQGCRTADVAGPGSEVVGTREMGQRIAEAIESRPGGADVAA